MQEEPAKSHFGLALPFSDAKLGSKLHFGPHFMLKGA
jgi:hypothetical protein